MIPSIIYPQCIEFDFMKQRPHHLMRAFARLGIKSYFFNVNSGDHGPKKRPPGVEEIEPNFFVVNNARNVPVPKPIIYYYTFPPQVDDPVRNSASFTIFDCVDEPAEEFAHWAKDHRRAIRTADLVLASAKTLYNRAYGEGKPTLLIPNGVDFKMFNVASGRVVSPPHDLRPIKKPIIGYYGALGTWVDTDLISYAAQALPQYHFVVIGPKYGNSVDKRVVKDDNMTIYPFIPYEELPRYLSMFDVCMIPFKQDSAVVKSCNPLKYWEYLAAGKPIVTTNMPECDPILSYVSKDREDFINNLKLAVEESRNPIPAIYEARMSLAKEHSWDAYASTIVSKIKGMRKTWDFLK